MNTLVLYFILANLGLAAFYLFFSLLLQKDTFFAGKRVALLVGILLALTYPLLDLSSWIQRSDSLVEYADVLRSRLPEIPVDAVKPTSEVLPGISDEAQFTNESAVSTTLEGQTGQGLETGLGSELGTNTPASVNSTVTPKNQSSNKDSIFSYLTLFDYLLLIYILTTAFLLFRIVRQLLRILQCRRKAERMKVHDQWVYVLKGCLSPFSFFGSIFMDPDAYSDKNLLEIIVHERAHIKQGHSYDVVFSELMCALCWINPFAWLLKRSLRENLEFLADRDVLKMGVDPKIYQYKLLQLSCHRSDANLANHFNVSQLKKRIVMMNKKRTSWEGLGKYALSLPLFAALLLTAYAWGQQHETEAKDLVAKATADSKVIAALTVDNTTLLAQNTPVEQAAIKPTQTTPGATVESLFTVDGIVYKTMGEKNVEVRTGRSKTGKLTIPTTVKQNGVAYTVTSIGFRAFADYTALQSISLPSSIKGIENEAFKGCEKLSSITLPASLTFLGIRVFHDCSSLKQLTVDEKNPELTAFEGVIFNKKMTRLISFPFNNATHYTIPSTVKELYLKAFCDCSGLTSIIIPSSVTTIMPGAFEGCTGLTSITIPATTVSIDAYEFSNLINLKQLNVDPNNPNYASIEGRLVKKGNSPSGGTQMGRGTPQSQGARVANVTPQSQGLRVPTGNPSSGGAMLVYGNPLSEGGMLANGSPKTQGAMAATSYPPSVLAQVANGNPLYNMPSGNMPSSSTFIVNGINYKATSANTVEVAPGGTYKGDLVIPAKVERGGVTYQVTTIGSQAFRNCPELTSLSLPAGITKLTVIGFANSPLLTRINVDPNDPNYTSIDGVVFDKNKTTLVKCIGKTQYVIPSSVSIIGDMAFADCSNLTSLVIPTSVTSIGVNAFVNCTSLTSLVIPSSVTSMGQAVFSNCKGLASITFSPSISFIADAMFGGCISLTSVTIPSSVTSIGQRAFQGCSKLTSVTIPEKVSNIPGDAFNACSAFKQYNVDPKNPYFASIDGVLFNKNKTLLISFPANKATAYVIPSTVKSIGANAFQDCKGLTTVTFPSSVISIGAYAFQQCTGLTSINLPPSLTSIGVNTFAYCSTLNAVTIPASVLTIEDNAFFMCSELRTVTIPASVMSIGRASFNLCNKLEAYRVDRNNQVYSSIDGVLFNKDKTTLIEYCPKQKPSNYVIPSSVTKIGDGAFSRCAGLASVSIPSSVTSIGKGAFQSCMSLSSITIPSSVASIGPDVFNACIRLQDLHCQIKNPLVVNDLFGYMVDKKTVKLYVPKGSLELYSKAKVWGEFASIVEE